jgi:hypothetical protein
MIDHETQLGVARWRQQQPVEEFGEGPQGWVAGAGRPLTPPPLRWADLSPEGEGTTSADALLLPRGEKVAA